MPIHASLIRSEPGTHTLTIQLTAYTIRREPGDTRENSVVLSVIEIMEAHFRGRGTLLEDIEEALEALFTKYFGTYHPYLPEQTVAFFVSMILRVDDQFRYVNCLPPYETRRLASQLTRQQLKRRYAEV